jgi:hypothetical protein
VERPDFRYRDNFTVLSFVEWKNLRFLSLCFAFDYFDIFEDKTGTIYFWEILSITYILYIIRRDLKSCVPVPLSRFLVLDQHRWPDAVFVIFYYPVPVTYTVE